MKTVFISGASQGIGAATAIRLAQAGYRLILNARNEANLQQVVTQVKASFPKTEVTTLIFDVADYAAARVAIQSLKAPFSIINVLVNNAGLALGTAHTHEADVADWDRMVDTNIKGLLYLTRLITPAMVARKEGHIIHLGSMVSHEVYEGGNVYCATKHAVWGLTKAMRLDFLPHNVRVSQVSPGAVETNFSVVRYKGDEQRAAKVYEGYEPLRAEDVADAIAYVIGCPPNVCVNEIYLSCTAQFGSKIVRK